ncbi:MAG: hypothetical protein ACTSSG_05550 [Candidatus Heimdallarchaeaceae archaeon]
MRIPTSSIAVRIIRLILVIVSPYILAFGITKLWERLSITVVKPIKKGKELIGLVATVYVPVDNKGGLIEIDLGEGYGTQKFNAKSFDFYKRFERDEKVRIVAIKSNVYLVDTL